MLAVLLAWAALVSGPTGCQHGPSTRSRALSPAETSPQSLELRADWDDLAPAIGAALARTELVRVRDERPDDATLVVLLRSSRDEPGRFVAERIDPAGTPDPVRVRLTCRVGRFGDPARERHLVEFVARRLEQLRGVSVAPLDW